MQKLQPYFIRYSGFRAKEAVNILREAKEDDPLISSTPPVKPKGGDIFLFLSKGNATDDWKCDQYRWIHNGVARLPKNNPLILKYYFIIDTPKGSSDEFRRHAYKLLGSDGKFSNSPFVLIHYLGDQTIAYDFPHGNQKKHNERNYCQQCPSLRITTAEQVEKTDPAKLYKTEIAAIDCHPALVKVMKPRDIKLVC